MVHFYSDGVDHITIGDNTIAAEPTPEIEVAISGTPPVGTIFKSALELKQTPGSFVPQLRNGVEATTLNWPVSFYAWFETAKGPASCTAALVGPYVLLTAAHCVSDDGALSFKFGEDTYKTLCQKHDDYTKAKRDASADFALCRVTVVFPLSPGFRYETISTPPLDTMIGKAIVLTGFGCISDSAKVQVIDGKYRVGSNSVAQTSDSSPPLPPLTADYYKPFENNNLITARAGANLCPSDSGGPAFQIVPGLEQGDEYSNRVLVGVNSRVVYADKSHKVYGQSIISATGGPAFKDWAISWANQKDKNNKCLGPGGQCLDICGLNGHPAHCRGSGT